MCSNSKQTPQTPIKSSVRILINYLGLGMPWITWVITHGLRDSYIFIYIYIWWWLELKFELHFVVIKTHSWISIKSTVCSLSIERLFIDLFDLFDFYWPRDDLFTDFSRTRSNFEWKFKITELHLRFYREKIHWLAWCLNAWARLMRTSAD